jgi:hypothetical protein
MVRRLAIPILIVGAAAGAWADRIPPGSELEYPGFAQFYNLEYDEALVVFRAQVQSQPSADAESHR